MTPSRLVTVQKGADMSRPFPLDFAALEPDSRPRRWLVLPPGFTAAAAPDQESPVFTAAPEVLLDAFLAAAEAEPRVRRLREEGGQVELVQRSLVFRFPDYVTVHAVAHGGGSALCLYSRAVVGYSDLGVNEKRARRWIAAASRRLAQAEGSAQ